MLSRADHPPHGSGRLADQITDRVKLQAADFLEHFSLLTTQSMFNGVIPSYVSSVFLQVVPISAVKEHGVLNTLAISLTKSDSGSCSPIISPKQQCCGCSGVAESVWRKSIPANAVSRIPGNSNVPGGLVHDIHWDERSGRHDRFASLLEFLPIFARPLTALVFCHTQGTTVLWRAFSFWRSTGKPAHRKTRMIRHPQQRVAKGSPLCGCRKYFPVLCQCPSKKGPAHWLAGVDMVKSRPFKSLCYWCDP